MRYDSWINDYIVAMGYRDLEAWHEDRVTPYNAYNAWMIYVFPFDDTPKMIYYAELYGR